jgi:hypothetical protein
MKPKKIDYNDFITREHIDWDIYNAKFKFVDKVNSLSKPHPKYLKQILKDPTMFSYMFLKLNNKPLRLHAYQDMILNDKHQFKIFRAARQIGKSLCLDIKSAHNLCIDHGHDHNECIISGSLNQATFQMRRVKQMLNSANFNWHESKGDVDNATQLSVNIMDEKDTRFIEENRPQKIKYTNLLVIAPCSSGALGYDFHEVNLDEFEYWKDVDTQDFFNNVIEPTTYTTNGNISTFSNPNGSESYVAELEQLKLPCGNKKFHTYVFSFMDYPDRTEQELEIRKTGKTRQQIESQLLAIRSISDKYYFSQDEIECSYSDKLNREKDWVAKGKPTYWFLDVGAKHDQSVLVGGMPRLDTDKKDSQNNPLTHIDIFCIHVYPAGYPLSRVVGSFDESHSTDGWHQEKSVNEHLKECQIIKNVNPTLGVDVTGNSGISPLFKSVGLTPVDIIFSGPKKWSMYQRMKYFLEQKLLHVIKNKEYDYQMKRIVVTKLKTSTYNRVGHENDDDHDDVPDSIAGLIYLADNPVLVTPSVRFF